MSNEVKTKEKVDMDPKYIIKLTVTLFVTCVIVAGLLGAVNMVIRLPIGLPGVIAFGLFSGVFTGTWAMALTEIVDAVPVFSRRIRLKTGMPWLILSMALGRAAGAWIHAYFGYGW